MKTIWRHWWVVQWVTILFGVGLAIKIVLTGGAILALIPAFIAGAFYGQWDMERVVRSATKK